jgi:hypothetical protein
MRLISSCVVLACLVVSHADTDLLFVPPLDTTAVVVDSTVSVAALESAKAARRNAPSPAALVAREVYPHFGAALARAARGVEVIDSSAAASQGDPDSSRFRLVIQSFEVSQASRTVARRTVPPSPPGFDPATGEMTPGVRRAYSEGPGKMTTLTATAAWHLWDLAGDSVLASGKASGATVFRGDAQRKNWNEAARELAMSLLQQTKFSPF